MTRIKLSNYYENGSAFSSKLNNRRTKKNYQACNVWGGFKVCLQKDLQFWIAFKNIGDFLQFSLHCLGKMGSGFLVDQIYWEIMIHMQNIWGFLVLLLLLLLFTELHWTALQNRRSFINNCMSQPVLAANIGHVWIWYPSFTAPFMIMFAFFALTLEKFHHKARKECTAKYYFDSKLNRWGNWRTL